MKIDILVKHIRRKDGIIYDKKNNSSPQSITEIRVLWFGVCFSLNGSWKLPIIEENINGVRHWNILEANLFFLVQ